MPAGSSVGLSRDLLEATLDLVPFPTLLVEPGSARIVFANRAADELAGGRFARADGAEHYAGLYPLTDADGAEVGSDRHPAVRAARGERIEGVQVDWHLPGGVRSLLVSGATVPPTDDREALVIVAFEDISLIRRAEAEAHAAQALLDTFFASASVGMAFLDRALRFRRPGSGRRSRSPRCAEGAAAAGRGLALLAAGSRPIGGEVVLFGEGD
jgi:PAS domain-containing protein